MSEAAPLPSANDLRSLLTYDPTTGAFAWRRTLRNGKGGAGAPAGRIDHQGYVKISFGGREYSAHRLAFLFMGWSECPALVDHRNGDPRDNRWQNLRPATAAQNTINRGSYGSLKKGVFRRREKFGARICYAGQRFHLGTFATEGEAHLAYRAAAERLHGAFARFE